MMTMTMTMIMMHADNTTIKLAYLQLSFSNYFPHFFNNIRPGHLLIREPIRCFQHHAVLRIGFQTQTAVPTYSLVIIHPVTPKQWLDHNTLWHMTLPVLTFLCCRYACMSLVPLSMLIAMFCLLLFFFVSIEGLWMIYDDNLEWQLQSS